MATGVEVNRGLGVSGAEALGALALTQSDVRNLAAVAKVARGYGRLENAISAAAQRANGEAIQQFKEGSGDAWKACLADKMNIQDEHAIELSPWPDSAMSFCHVLPCSAEVAKNAVSYAIQNTGTSNLQKALEMDWAVRTQPITGSEAHIAVEDIAGAGCKADAECREHGVCLCSPDGKQVKKLWAKFMQAFKPPVKRGSEGREYLKEGKLVLKLHWQEVPAGAVAGGGEGMAVEAPLMEGHAYWQVSWVCLAPYRPSFQILQWLADDGDQRKTLRATWSCLPIVRAMESIDRALKWDLQFWRLQESLRPFAAIDPSVVLVEVFTEDPVVFWDPSRQRRAPRRRAAKADPAAALMLGDAPEEDGAGAEPGDEAAREIDPELDDDGLGEVGGMGLAADAAAVGPDAESEAPDVDELERLLAAVVAATEDEPAAAASSTVGPAASSAGSSADVFPAAAAPAAAGSAASGSGYLVPAGRPKSINVPFEGGAIAYYYSDRRFEAKCPNKKHGRCIRTRYVKADPGRPLGDLAFWIRNCSQKLRDEHVWAPLGPHDARDAARKDLHAVPGAAPLFTHEREKADGAPDEP